MDEAALGPMRDLLHKERSNRVRPGLDDKVLADWNGLAIAALAQAAGVFRQPGWIALAERAFAFVEGSMTRETGSGQRLGHSWRAGRLLFPGLASDHAAMIRAAIALYEATGQGRYLDRALAWQAALDRHHADPDRGGYLLTADDAEGLIVRPHSTADDAIPNHNGLIAQNLVRLAALSGDDTLRAKADRLFDALLPFAAQNAFGHLSLLNALDMRLGLAEIVLVGEGAAADALHAEALALPPALRSVMRVADAGALHPGHPAQAKVAATKGAAAFVCRGETCSLPVSDAKELRGLVFSATRQ